MARQSSKVDVELAVSVLLNEVKLIKKQTSQIAGLKETMDVIILYLKALEARIHDNFQETNLQSAVTADKVI
jgi:hypothetical protein